jgi:hypothetical protein
MTSSLLPILQSYIPASTTMLNTVICLTLIAVVGTVFVRMASSLGSCYDELNAPSKSGLHTARRLTEMSELRNMSASFKNAGMGAKMGTRKRANEDGPDVGDSCVVM